MNTSWEYALENSLEDIAFAQLPYFAETELRFSQKRGETDIDTMYACEEFVKNCMEKHFVSYHANMNKVASMNKVNNY